MSLHSTCTPRGSVFSGDRRATVLSLDTFLKGEVDGPSFFEENYFTTGMTTLVDRAFRHLAGQRAGSSIFHLSQSMGGGKTHSMIALGLLARDPGLRRAILGASDPAPSLTACKVIGFNGRHSDELRGIWGALADQLGKLELFEKYFKGQLQAPGPEAWKTLFGKEPVIVFLDELPPYFSNSVTVPVGGGNLATVTVTALANLFVAAAELDNVCVILSDLAGSNYTGVQASLQQAFDRATADLDGEAKRLAVPITPVNPNGDELYHILRKRLFLEVAGKDEISRIATAYQQALKEAVDMNLTTSDPAALNSKIHDSYPFHPDLRSLVGKFKENAGFQQTRGVIRLMQMIVANLWNSGKAAKNDLIHPYDFDLNVDEIASEFGAINNSLSEAIANDIAHGGDAEVEEIDRENRTCDASDAAKLLLVASLSNTGAIPGLQEYEMIDCLQKPGRDLSSFKSQVLDKLNIRAWYLHRTGDGRLYFKNQQNLAAKLRSVALALHTETVDQMLRKHLEEYFKPALRDCYQNLHVLPPPDEVQVEQEKVTLIVVRPGFAHKGLPISEDWQKWWDQIPYKNRVLFLSGSRDTFQNVLDSARQTRALQSIADDLKASNLAVDDPQWKALDDLQGRVPLHFFSALKSAFDQIVYPSINNALRSSGIDLAFAGNSTGEPTVRQTLISCSKFEIQIQEDAFRARAEARLFGGADSKTVLWADLKRAAAVNTNWPLHKPSALDELRKDAVKRDLWRDEGNYVRRGPFPPPTPEVSVRVLSEEEDGDGITYLKIEPLHAPSVVFETGNNLPTSASSPVPTPQKFEARGMRYQFLARDPNDPGRTSSVFTWTAHLRLKYDLKNLGDRFEVSFQAFPKCGGVAIRYTTDGTDPSHSGAATYAGKFSPPPGTRVVLAVAVHEEYGVSSEKKAITIPQKGAEERTINPVHPAAWTKITKLDDTGAVWDWVGRLEGGSSAQAFDISITAESLDGFQSIDYSGSLVDGYSGANLRALITQLSDLVAGGKIRLSVSKLTFSTGQDLLDWLQATSTAFDLTHVSQT